MIPGKLPLHKRIASAQLLTLKSFRAAIRETFSGLAPDTAILIRAATEKETWEEPAAHWCKSWHDRGRGGAENVSSDKRPGLGRNLVRAVGMLRRRP